MEVIELSEDEMEVNIKDEIKVFMDCLRFFKPFKGRPKFCHFLVIGAMDWSHLLIEINFFLYNALK